MTSLLRILRFAPQLHRLYLGIAVSSVLAAVLAGGLLAVRNRRYRSASLSA